MKTLTLNLDDQLYNELSHNADNEPLPQYIGQILQSYMQNFKSASNIKTNTADNENFGSLYEVLKTLPKASYNENPMTIQNKMRDEWT